jgi:endoglucanase
MRFRSPFTLLLAALLCCGALAAAGQAQRDPSHKGGGQGCGPQTPPVAGVDAQAVDPGAPNPLLGLTYFIDKEWGIPWRHYQAARGKKKQLIGKIATHPQFKWFGRWDVRKYGAKSAISQYLDRVDCASPGTVPQIVSFFHEGTGCHNGFTGGGAAEDARYRKILKGFAEGIGTHRVVIAFEPDSLGTIDCLIPSRRKARTKTLAYGIEQLSKVPNATVYVDAGAADWMAPAKAAKLLKKVGVRRVRGFMLNATHMVKDGPSIRYGKKISKRLGGKHFIVNTSDNGRGPMYRRLPNGRRQTIWCNPPNSGLGKPATTDTGSPAADALLRVNRPGTSHGACKPPGVRGPSVGQWFESRALSMARRANW